MMNIRPVLLVTGVVLSLMAVAMAIPAAVDAVHDQAEWRTFLASSGVTLYLGLALVAANWGGRCKSFSIRQMVLLTVSGWVSASIAAAFPFAFSSLHLTATDSWFEAVGGVTSSAASVLHGLDQLPPGLLLWRAMLQWLGGAAFLAMSILVLPDLAIGGMQMFRVESNNGAGDRVMGRGVRVVGQILVVYAVITLALTLLLWASGMSRFPALLHALSAISCGGFSSADGSVGAWRTPNADWVILLGMLLGGAPFIVYLHLLRRRWRQVWNNAQLRWYLGLCLMAGLVIGLWLLLDLDGKPLPSLRHGLFTAVSVMTGSGFATVNWGNWSGLPVAVMFFLTFVGGCAGSAAGGLKIFRLQILLTSARVQLTRLLRPHSVVLPVYDRKPVPDQVRESVLGFLFVYCLSFAVVAMLLGMFGLNFMSAITASASALANLGPSMTPAFGPMAGYEGLPDPAKWLLSLAMLYGRMEMFLPLVLVFPEFWKH